MSSSVTGSSKYSILNLPLAPSLPEFLTPDPAIPSVQSLLSVSSYSSKDATPESSEVGNPAYKPKPSILRRSRPVKGAHFSYVTPLPLSFPYAVKASKIKPRKVSGEAVGDGSAVKEGAVEEAVDTAKEQSSPPVLDVEDYLASLEPNLQEPVKNVTGDAYGVYTSEDRNDSVGSAKLVGLSQKCLQDVLPNLDTGDAFTYLQKGTDGEEQEKQKREDLTKVLAGHIVILREPKGEDDKGFAPWSLCYGGHQFGSWASQLGDGRAVSILSTPSAFPAYHKGTYYPPLAELQLKGAGRTPYSRFADGLAVLRSSVREYLGSEAMAALSIPTSRALSLVHLPDVQVQRETMETGAIVCRVAPSWIRIGSFELLWSRDDWDALRELVNYTGHEIFGFGKEGATLKDEPQDKSLAAKVLRETSRRTARLVAGWQSTGFMHGVLNTDNISIAGLTIDYGPYAWMDVYNANHICNHSDGEGRYSFRAQPSIGVEAIYRLGDALGEMIGAELELSEEGSGGQVSKGWAESASKHEGWREKGRSTVEEIATEFTSVYVAEYRALMSKKLGLLDSKQDDFRDIFDPMLQLMSEHHLDFSRTFRLLSQFTTTSASNFERFLDRLVPTKLVPKYLHDTCRDEWKSWLTTYQKRLEESERAVESDSGSRRERMDKVNPRFILRQWILEEAIRRLEKDDDIAFLQRVLDMATHPFEGYGEENVDEDSCGLPDNEIAEQRRLCEIGDEQMLGFQCSCSS